MTTKRYRTMGILAVGILSCLCLVTVTRSWFISLNETPPGSITSGVVHFLPEGGMSHRDLFTYGNLISGNSIDDEGVPHVLPGDRLLPGSTMTVRNNVTTQTLTTSVVHLYEEGESEGTVIHREERHFAQAAPDPDRVILYQQRELMGIEVIPDQWTHNSVAIQTPPTIGDLASYRAVTTSKTTTSGGSNGGFPTTVTTTDTVVTYTRASDGDHYVRASRRIVTVTHEPATYTENGAPVAGGAIWDSAKPLPRLTSTETVLYADPVNEKVTRSYLSLTELRDAKASDTANDKAVSIPLTLGNLSTVPTNVRLAASVTLYPHGGGAEALEFRMEPSGAWCVGKEKNGDFIELLRLETADAATAGEVSGYHWVPLAPDTTTAPTWDLTLNAPPADSEATVIPPISGTTPTPEPTGNTPEPTDAVLPKREPSPTLYKAISALHIAINPSFGTTQEVFETGFNEFYCTGAPKILLKVVYLAKQSNYMDWSEFRTETLTLQF